MSSESKTKMDSTIRDNGGLVMIHWVDDEGQKDSASLGGLCNLTEEELRQFDEDLTNSEFRDLFYEFRKKYEFKRSLTGEKNSAYIQARRIVRDIKNNPARHKHETMDELIQCCKINGNVHTSLMQAHEGIHGRNGGLPCDVSTGPCSCGAFH